VLGGTTVKQLIELSGTPGREFVAAARLPVAVMLTAPYEALARWTDAEATFEALDDLVEVVP
jgi:hypothetical protein